MLSLSWSPSALDDLDAAAVFISQDNPRAAATMAGHVLESVEYLATYPNLGRSGRVRGTRELVVSGTPFVVMYRVRLDVVQILRVLHHARKWP
jgi:addiction module RelE/StbE family toxin